MVNISSSSSRVGEESCGCFVNAVFVLERLGPRALTLSAGRSEMALMAAAESSGTSQLHTSKPSIWGEHWVLRALCGWMVGRQFLTALFDEDIGKEMVYLEIILNCKERNFHTHTPLPLPWIEPRIIFSWSALN